MGFTTLSNMGIKVPTRNTKNWDDEMLTTFTSLDAHDHSSGKGVQIPTGGIADDAVTAAKILLVNNAGLEQRDSGGTGRVLINLNASDTLQLLDSSGNELLEGSATASAVNHIELTNAATTANPMLSSTGESNIGLILGDSNDNEALILESTASAVNEITITNAATGNPALLEASGETNVGLDIKSKGTGALGLFTNSNEALNIDSAGIITTPLQPAFLAYNSAQDSNATGDGTAVTIDFDTEVFDLNSDFASDTFTAPVTGKYLLNTTVLMQQVSDATSILLQIVTSNRTYTVAQCGGVNSADASGNLSVSGSAVVDMDSSDTAFVRLTASNGTKIIDIVGGATLQTFFSGYLVA